MRIVGKSHIGLMMQHLYTFVSFAMSQDPKRFGIVSDRIHGTGVFTYMYHKFQTHEGQHTMHGSYGCLFPISKICKYLS